MRKQNDKFALSIFFLGGGNCLLMPPLNSAYEYSDSCRLEAWKVVEEKWFIPSISYSHYKYDSGALI